MSLREDIINLRVQINGEMAGKTMKELRGEIRSAKAETDNLKVGTDEYNKSAAKLALIEGKYKGIQKETREAANEIAGLSKKTSSFGDVFKGALAAISFDRIISGAISFGKESVEAFLDADRQAQKLKFAVEGINGETGGGLRELNKQADELQKKGFFDDDDIRKSQAMLATFGLHSSQIKSLIPQIIDLAKASGDDLTSATEKSIKAMAGQSRGLKSVGIDFKDTGSKTENLGILTEKLTKFQGAAEESMKTMAGQLEAQKIATEELAESVGEKLAPVFLTLKQAALGALDSLISLFTADFWNGTQYQKEQFERLGASAEQTASIMNTGFKFDYLDEKGRQLASGLISITDGLDQWRSRLAKTGTEAAYAEAIDKISGSIDREVAKGKGAEASVKLMQEARQKFIEDSKKAAAAEQKIEDDLTQKGEDEKKKRDAEALKKQDEFNKNTARLRELLSEANASAIKDDEQRELALLEAKAKKQADEIKKMLANEKVKADALTALEDKTARERADIEKKYNDRRIKESEAAQKELSDILNQETEADRVQVEIQAQRYTAAAADRVRATKEGTAERLAAEKELALMEEQLALAKLDPLINNEAEKVRIHQEFLDKIAALDEQSADKKIQTDKKTNQKIEELARDVENKIFSVVQARERKETDMKLKNLQKQLSNKSISQEQYDKEERAIKNAAAKDEKERALFQVTLEGILMVAKALAQAGGAFFSPNVILAGIQAGIQIAAVAATPIPEFAMGGPTFAKGGPVAQPQVGLIGEAGPEWVAPNWMLSDPHYANTFAALENVRQRGFAAGGPTLPSPVSAGGQTANGENAAINQALLGAVNQLNQELAHIRINGIIGIWDWQRFQDGLAQMGKIQADSSL